MSEKPKLPEWVTEILAQAMQPEHAQQAPPKADDPIKLGEGIGKSKDESTAAVIHGKPPEPKAGEKPSKGQTAMDSIQLGLDAVGVVDPTPVVDGVNAAISLVRAVKDPKRRGEHLQNAAISAVSMVPYIGDTAKLLKAKRAGKTVSNAVEYSADAAKAKGEARESAREHVDRVIDAWKERNKIDGGDDSAKDADASKLPPPGPEGSTRDIESERETEEGLEQQEKWNDWLKQSTEKVIGFTGAVGKFGVGIWAGVEGLKALNTGVIALNRDLAEYNGQLAQSYAEFEADEIQRKMEKGQAVDGPMSRLLEQQSELKSNVEQFTNPMKAIAIEVQAFGTKMVNYMFALVEAIPGVKGALEAIEDKLGGGGDELTDWQNFFADVSDGKFDGKAPSFDGRRSKILPDRDHREVFGP